VLVRELVYQTVQMLNSCADLLQVRDILSAKAIPPAGEKIPSD